MNRRTGVVSLDNLLVRIASVLAPHLGTVAEVEDHTAIVEAGLGYFCWGKPAYLERLVGKILPTETMDALFSLVLDEIQKDMIACFGAVWPARNYSYAILGEDLFLYEDKPHVHPNLWGDAADE